MGMTCSSCKEWSETIYNTGGLGVLYCPCCGAELSEHPPEYDDEDEEDET